MVYDLLHDPSSSRPLAIHETVEDGVFVEGLTEFVVANPADCLGIVAKGQANRCAPGQGVGSYFLAALRRGPSS
jgi:hypothetical protein